MLAFALAARAHGVLNAVMKQCYYWRCSCSQTVSNLWSWGLCLKTVLPSAIRTITDWEQRRYCFVWEQRISGKRLERFLNPMSADLTNWKTQQLCQPLSPQISQILMSLQQIMVSRDLHGLLSQFQPDAVS